jgi:hypothetical protein
MEIAQVSKSGLANAISADIRGGADGRDTRPIRSALELGLRC